MPNIKNARFGALKLNKRKLLVIGVLVVLIIIGVFIYRKHNQNNTAILPIEKDYAQTSQQYLNSQDYKSYQTTQAVIANEYIGTGEYSNAERVLNMIIAKVPSDKITSDTYRSFWYLYQQNGDTQNRKKYALLTAEKLKEEGQAKAAAAFEKDASSN